MPITDDIAQEILKKITTTQRAPDTWRRITEKEFAQSMFFTYSPRATSSVQFNAVPRDEKEERGIPFDATLYVYHDGTGLAISADYWAGKVAFYRFGCAHEYRELTQEQCRQLGISHHGRCWHVTRCDKCGNIDAYDSSD